MDAHKNLAYSAVATAPSPASSGTTLSVTAGHGSRFPDAPFNATVWPSGSVPIPTNAEIIRVTSKGTGDNWTIVRAQEGTSARSVIVGDQIAATITAKTLTDVENQILDGWIDDSAETWTYASATTFTIAADVRSKYTVGTRIKLTQSATVKYFVVSADPTYGGGNTTVTITGGSDYSLANSAISANYHSYAANPQGYPGWFNYTPTINGFSSTSSVICKFCVVGQHVTAQIRIIGTSDQNYFNFTAPIALPGSGGGGGNSDFQFVGASRVQNNGAWQTNFGYFNFSSTTQVDVLKAPDAGTTDWTAANGKAALGVLTYEI